MTSASITPVNSAPLARMRRRGARQFDGASLPDNAASGIAIDLRDEQGGHTRELRVRNVVQLGYADPLRRIGQLFCGNAEEIVAGDGYRLHCQVLAFVRLIAARET